jgi:hypothetical protein
MGHSTGLIDSAIDVRTNRKHSATASGKLKPGWGREKVDEWEPTKQGQLICKFGDEKMNDSTFQFEEAESPTRKSHRLS